MAHIYRYAIIRLVPFAHRGEAVNVGIVVFRDDRLDVRFGAAPSILDYFGVQPSSLSWMAESFIQADDKSKSIAERAADMSRFSGTTLSEIGWFKTADDSQYDLRVAEILSEYVEKPKKTKSRRENINLTRELKKIFKEYRLFSNKMEDIERHKIVANMPVGPSGKLHVDFLLKNGAYHATETLDFRKSEDAGPSELKNAALANVTFQHAREVLGGSTTKCYLVYAAPSLIETAVSPALEIAQKDTSASFNLESRIDKANYLETILSAAGVNHLFSEKI